MSDLFFTSDQHFGHERIIGFCKRPFKNVKDQTEQLIKNHNNKVPKGARVYHCGDIFWRTLSLKECLDIIYALNGQHYFIWGNHDENMENNAVLRGAFVWCKDIAVLKKSDRFPRIILCHYAMRVWPGSHRGDWHLYGHTHNKLPEIDNLSFDVGVDANNFAPVSIDEVILKMEQKKALGYGDPMRERIKKEKWDKSR